LCGMVAAYANTHLQINGVYVLCASSTNNYYETFLNCMFKVNKGDTVVMTNYRPQTGMPIHGVFFVPHK